MWLSPFIVRARPCFQDGVFRVPKNGMLETNKPLAMRVVGNALAYRKNLQCYNNAGSPTALQAEEDQQCQDIILGAESRHIVCKTARIHRYFFPGDHA